MKGLLAHIQESGVFTESFVVMSGSMCPYDQETCMQAVIGSIQRAKKGNEHAKAVERVFTELSFSVTQDFPEDPRGLPPVTLFEYMVRLSKSWLVPIDQFFVTTDLVADFILKIRTHTPPVVSQNPAAFWGAICRISETQNTSILFQLTLKHTSRNYLKSLISDGIIPSY